MNIQKEIQITMLQPVIGYCGEDEAEVFDYFIRKYGVENICLICSLVYSFGRIQGIRSERSRRKKQVQYAPAAERS